MPSKLTFVLLTALPLLLAAPSHAALTWQSNAYASTATATDTRVSHTFTFKNDSDKPVTIDSVKTSCGCTTAKLAKRTYSPGETGTIEATFDFGPRTGKQIKTITVQTDEPNTPPQVLTMTVQIPEVAKLSPRMVYWSIDHEAQPKTVSIEAADAGPIRLVSVEPENDQIEVQTKTVKEGERYVVTLRPLTTSAPLRRCART